MIQKHDEEFDWKHDKDLIRKYDINEQNDLEKRFFFLFKLKLNFLNEFF